MAGESILLDALGALVYKKPVLADGIVRAANGAFVNEATGTPIAGNVAPYKEATFIQRVLANDMARRTSAMNEEWMNRAALAQQIENLERDKARRQISTMARSYNPHIGDFGAPQSNIQPSETEGFNSVTNNPTARALMTENYGSFTSGLPTKANVNNLNLTNKENESWVTSTVNPSFRPTAVLPELAGGAAIRTGLVPETAATRTVLDNVLTKSALDAAQRAASRQGNVEAGKDIDALNSIEQGTVNALTLKLAKQQLEGQLGRFLTDEETNVLKSKLANEQVKDDVSNRELLNSIFRKSLDLKSGLFDVNAKTERLKSIKELHDASRISLGENIIRRVTDKGISGPMIDPNGLNEMQLMSLSAGLPVGNSNPLAGIVNKNTGEPLITESLASMLGNPEVRAAEPVAKPVAKPTRPAIGTGFTPTLKSLPSRAATSVSSAVKNAGSGASEIGNLIGDVITPMIRSAVGGYQPSPMNKPLNVFDIAARKAQLGYPRERFTDEEWTVLQQALAQRK